ncbi:DUF4255 domain-containing protein [Ascidiimonas sp. W6]|uniref:DUF4255 domain-containing protein n=1 Tax=Ascidiimonas meishanensis TaxID=3128903 RepID=UPI0030EBF1F3
MIDKAFVFIQNFLNQQIKMLYGIDEDRVVAESLVNPDGSTSDAVMNKVVVSLVNIEHETTVNTHQYVSGASNDYGKVPNTVFLNLYLLVAANYESGNYQEALKMLSSVIGIFQSNTYFVKSKNPDMPPLLDKLTFEIYNLPINELSHIWGGLGAKYVPSIIYKVRMIAVQENKITREVPGVGGLDNEVGARTN